MNAPSPKLDTLSWGLQNLLDRKPEDAERVDDFLVVVEDLLQGALAARLADVCAAMGVPDSDEFEVLTDFELPTAGTEGDWAEAAALVDLGGRGELVVSLELYRVLEDDTPAGQAAFLAVRLLPTEEWPEDELADFAALLSEDAEVEYTEDSEVDAPDGEATEADEADEPEGGDALLDEEQDDEGEDLAIVAELDLEDASRLAEIAIEILDEWIDAWKAVRGD